MSPSEVKRAVPGLLKTEGMLAMEGKTAGRQSATFFYFAGDQLAAAGVVFTGRQTAAGRYVEEFNRVKELLTKKYGEPSSDGVEWSDSSLFRDSPEHFPTAVTMGHATPYADWETEESLIRVQCVGKAFTANTNIIYASKQLREAYAEERQREQTDDL